MIAATRGHQATEAMDPADLAAFAEGRLHGAERELVIAHLASCAKCRKVLGVAMRAADHVAAREGDEERRFRPAAVIAAAAAVAASVALVGALVVWPIIATPSPPSRGEWLAEMPPAKELATPRAPVWRGGGTSSELIELSTELGRLLVDLDVAVARDDAGGTAEILNRMAAILEIAGSAGDDVATLGKIATKGDARRMKVALTSELPALEKRMRQQFSPFYLDLGAFAEEAQIAALSGRGDFVKSWRVGRYCKWVLSQQEEPLSDTVRESLLTLRSADSTAAEVAEAASAILRSPTG
jgi:putative zinc finger protein